MPKTSVHNPSFRTRYLRAAVVFTMLIGTVVAFSGVAANASERAPLAQGISANKIVIGEITSLTGPAAANYYGAVQGAQARFDLQNAEGGVNGRKFQLIAKDDGSSSSTAGTAEQSLIQSSKVFGLIMISDFTVPLISKAQADGIPEIGLYGPQSASDTYAFGFNGVSSPFVSTGKCACYSTDDKELVSLGVKRAAFLGFPLDSLDVEPDANAASRFGLVNAYDNYSLSIGQTAMTTVALAMKSANVDGVFSLQLDTSDFALLAALKDLGMKVKYIDSTAYGQPLLDDPSALSDAQGLVIQVTQQPVEDHSAATIAQQSAFSKYQHFSGVPNLNWTIGWVSADMYITGLKAAEKNPTQASFAKALHDTMGYTAGGLLPAPLVLAQNEIGKGSTSSCSYFVRVQGHSYVPLNGGKPVCGTKI